MEPAAGFKFQFAPDLKKVSEVICKTWAKPCWNYDEGLLTLHIKRPSGDQDLNVAQISETGEVASFQAYMPFDIMYYDKPYKAVFASFLTVSGAFQGKGLGGPQQGMLIEKAIEKNYDIYITMCEVGATSNYAVEKIFARKNLPVKVVNVCAYVAGINDLIKPVLPEAASGKTREYAKTDFAQAKALISEIGKNTPLRKVIPDEDIDFLLTDRPHCRTYIYETGGRVRALANILMLEVLEPDGESKLNIYFDNVSFGDLNQEEQEEFLGDVLIDLQKDNFHTAFMPKIGYVALEAFKKYRFRLAPRQLNLYIAPLKKDILLDGIKEVDTFYLDVY